MLKRSWLHAASHIYLQVLDSSGWKYLCAAQWTSGSGGGQQGAAQVVCSQLGWPAGSVISAAELPSRPEVGPLASYPGGMQCTGREAALTACRSLAPSQQAAGTRWNCSSPNYLGKRGAHVGIQIRQNSSTGALGNV